MDTTKTDTWSDIGQPCDNDLVKWRSAGSIFHGNITSYYVTLHGPLNLPYILYNHCPVWIWVCMTWTLTSNKYRSQWPLFHGQVILTDIFKSVWCISITSFFLIVSQYDPEFDPKIIVGHSDLHVGLGGSVGCAVPLETRSSQVQPPPRSATFFRGDWSWNIFYVILSLPLIQEGQLSVSGERMCTILVNRLED